MPSSEKLTLSQRLHACMCDVDHVPKDAPTGIGGVKGRSYDTVATAVRRVFAKHGVCMISSVVSESFIGLPTKNDPKQQGLRLLFRFTVFNADDKADAMLGDMYGTAPIRDDKADRICHTLATKAFLCKLLMLESGEEDRGAFDADSVPGEPRNPDQVATAQEKKAFVDQVTSERETWLNENRVAGAPSHNTWLRALAKYVLGSEKANTVGELGKLWDTCESGAVSWVTGEKAAPDQLPPEEEVQF